MTKASAAQLDGAAQSADARAAAELQNRQM